MAEVSMENPYTRKVANWIAKTRYEDIPTHVLDYLKLMVLDSLGCGIYCSQLPWSQIATQAIVEMQPASGDATIWGTDKRAYAGEAALLNGTFIQGYEIDDLHTTGQMHVGAAVLPPALAVAEHRGGIDGKRFLTAAYTGYEMGPRIGQCMGTRPILLGWHSGAVWGALAGAISAGKVVGLDEQKMIWALGNAGTQAAGLMAVQYGAMWKRMNEGKAAQNGVYAALLAEKGFTGIVNVFESEYGGFCTTFTASKDQFDLAQLTVGLGEKYETLRVGIKIYSSNGSTQTSIDAIRKLQKERPFTAADVDKITVWCTRFTYDHVGWKYVPDSITTAQFTIAYCVAIQILEGDVFIDQFTEEKIRNPKVLALTDRVECIHDPNLDARGLPNRHNIRMEVRLKNGEVLRTEVPHRRGSEVNPVSREEIIEKFDKLVTKVFKPAKVNRLKDMILNLESLKDVAQLGRELAKA